MPSILTLFRSKRLAQVIVVLGCVRGVEPARAEFRKIPVTSVESCAVRLAGAEDIPYTCRLYRDAQAKLPVWEMALEFEFGRLTYPQWQQLVTTYASWHNHRNLADYDRDRNYTLMDFMPPVMQAWNRHQFHTQDLLSITTSAANPASQLILTKLVTNCWGTLYEILRLAKQDNPPAPMLFVTDSHSMLRALRQRSTQIQTHPQPGDFVLVYHHHGPQTYLDHVALVVDQQLFFEKAGAGDHVPYRLVDRSMLERIWNPDVYTFEYRRPRSQANWQTPQQVFSPGDREMPLTHADHVQSPHAANSPNPPTTYFAMQQIPAFLSVKGRFRLSPDMYDRTFFGLE
ncbi:hypothetical protein [Acaryochloris sp. IP29b_bin.148]|uniref:hypothetical protein n=1 Tax=Acaryochloris sp. IP29b_bin.148 TaxID=2969218 RepID=UPI00260D3775|nr:hypothetical protein [Acaryochloris sp. IP29b_bin.148]